jgi:hypothetical protein
MEEPSHTTEESWSSINHSILSGEYEAGGSSLVDLEKFDEHFA